MYACCGWKVLMPFVICCQPVRWKSFIFYSPIPGQNGVTGGTGSSRKIFLAQSVRHWQEMEPSASRPITLLTLKGLKRPREQILILRWSKPTTLIHSSVASTTAGRQEGFCRQQHLTE